MSRRFAAIAEEFLPQGSGLPQDVWEYRHRLFVLTLWGHVVGLLIFGLVAGVSVSELFAIGLSVGGVALLAGAGWLSRRVSAVFVGGGLVLSSSLLVHFSGGYIEAHFHYFVVLFLLMLYQDWAPFLTATVLVILHHGVVGSLLPQSVYNHPDALAHPWKWSVMHGLFFGAAAVVCIAIWRVLEGAAKEQHRSANFLDSILDRMPILVFAKEAEELRHVRFNRACEELLGVSRAVVLGKKNHELFPEELAERYTAADREALDKGLVVIEEEPIVTRRRGTRFLRTKKFAVGGDDGSPKYLVGVSEDITDRKVASEVLQEQELKLRRFKRLLDRTQDCIFKFRFDDYGFIYVNEGAQRQVGYSEAELLQMTLLDIEPEFTQEQFERLIEPLVNRQKESVVFQTAHRHKDGHDIPVEVSLQLLDLEETEERRFLAIVRDVSLRKEAEVALAESEARFRQAVEFAPNGILMVNADGMITMVNKQVEALFDYQAHELVGQPLTILVPQQFRGGHGADMQRFFSARAARAMGRGRDLFGVRKDGTEFPVEIGLTPLDTPTGPQVLASILDITARKEAEVALAESEARFRQAVEFAPNGILMVNADGMITMVNKQVEALFDYQAHELVGQPLTILVPQQFRGGHGADMQRFFSARAARAMGRGRDLFGVRKDGTEFPVEIGLTPLDTPTGPQVLASILDITARKEAEKALMERQVLLDTANKELEAFAYSVSHDLRAPLRSINGFSQALMEDYYDKLGPEGQDYLQRVLKASERMGQLIDDLLGLSRATRRQFHREKEVDFSAMAMEIVEELRADDQDRKVDVRIEPGLIVSGDRGLLRVVLQNLLGNAWKFTAKQPEPQIEFGTTVDQGSRVCFVRDNGAGFDMAYADKLFTPFQRLHGQTEFPGTGIGLATVSRVIGRHGGRVWAEGAVGRGATIWFTL
ncbi:MAG: PAS domain S-box protein [Nitrospira sp.]|nr:PAS domain S-box protein [Nitrospira sp.]